MCVFDIEADSLTPTKIHVISYWSEDRVISLTDYKDMRAWVSQQKLLIGHNIISFDIPAIERILGVKVKAKLIDTLYLSWYLYPERARHGLEWWGEDFGIPKPEVKDWENLPLEVYVHRCEEDVKINQQLWKKQSRYLEDIYKASPAEALPIVSYLMFKADVAREQEERRWKLDVDFCQAAYDKLSALQAPMIESLKGVMPTVKKTGLKNPPAKPYKKDGTLSVDGAKWFALLREKGLPPKFNQPVEVLLREEEPNPNSPDQIKEWLFSLGWEPETFKFVKEDDGTERKIPQVKIPNSPDLCPSVLRLAEEEPAVESLVGLSVLKHRLGLLKGFLENHEDGFLKARVQGLTNTLRFKHTEIVNLPGVSKPWGEEIRGCLVARDGYELVGTDVVALENNTGDHYIFNLDPEYVLGKKVEGYDPHTEMCVIAGLITQDEEDFYKWYKEKR